MQYETVAGLEVHVELLSKTKIFCSCKNEFGGEPNSHCCPVCLGLPGSLPVLNKRVVELAMKAALALNCHVAEYSEFARKAYFYPDLPKAYQVSQCNLFTATDGYIEIEIDGKPKRIRIQEMHIEEDAGKLVHSATGDYSLVDHNRSGVPLIEIVSAPDIRSPEEGVQYLTKLKSILQYAGVSDCKMEEGSLRCDANISLRPMGSNEFGTKTELKNMNSFRTVQKAMEYEIERQKRILEKGEQVVGHTLRWDEEKAVTVPMRVKAQSAVFKYIPDPDLPPLALDKNWLNEIKATLPELADARKKRYIDEYGLPEYDADVLTGSKALADFFEASVKEFNEPKTVSNWIMGEFMAYLNSAGKEIDETPLTPSHLAGMLKLIKDGTISGKIAKDVFKNMVETGNTADVVVKEKGLQQITDQSEIESIIDKVLTDNPKSVEDFKNGKGKAIGFLVGQVMKASRGKANPQLVNQILIKKLS
jgi:aspartyl-tRNA(Asn)/glutamyl-tRNA(Gln) amidotransferase subunit B